VFSTHGNVRASEYELASEKLTEKAPSQQRPNVCQKRPKCVLYTYREVNCGSERGGGYIYIYLRLHLYLSISVGV